ncbi:hypothetical protein DFH09DRAFT_1345266 [Mycena vulgaris]|nr:hypothetical protein DFH09DRAFT_1345266 [Mycena vulgaris]
MTRVELGEVARQQQQQRALLYSLYAGRCQLRPQTDPCAALDSRRLLAPTHGREREAGDDAAVISHVRVLLCVVSGLPLLCISSIRPLPHSVHCSLISLASSFGLHTSPSFIVSLLPARTRILPRVGFSLCYSFSLPPSLATVPTTRMYFLAFTYRRGGGYHLCL